MADQMITADQECVWCLQSGHVWKDCPDWLSLHGLSLKGTEIGVHYAEPKKESGWFGFAILCSLAVVAILLVKDWVTQ